MVATWSCNIIFQSHDIPLQWFAVDSNGEVRTDPDVIQQHLLAKLACMGSQQPAIDRPVVTETPDENSSSSTPITI